MSAMRTESTKRPPMFTTYTEVEVDIDPEDLERAGWVYVGKKKGKDSDAGVTAEHVLTTVRRWHDDNHEGPWMWCDHDLCDQLRGRPHDGSDR